MINPMMLFKLKGLWDRITSNHPKMVPAIYVKIIMVCVRTMAIAIMVRR